LKPFFDRPRLLLTLVAIFWARNFVLGRGIVGEIPPVTLACLRWTLATLIFLPFAWPHLRRDAAAIRKNWLMLLFLGVIGAGCYNTLSYLGLVWAEALNGLVLSAAGPMFIALTAWGLVGDRLEPMQAVGLAAGFFGVLIIIAKGDLASLAAFRFNFGDILLIVGLITWSVYTAFLRKRPHISWQSFNISTYAVAAIANVPLALVEHRLGHIMKANAATIATIAYVAVFPSLLAYIFYNRGVELLGPTRTWLYMFLVPVFGSLLAVIFLGERLHLYHALGFAFIIGGVVVGSRRRRVRVAEAAEESFFALVRCNRCPKPVLKARRIAPEVV
jgi:drug/metabolite transporter (DMT)-like permease